MYERYCELRDLKGYKDADIARITGITKSTFSDWKNGRSTPKDEKLKKIAECLGTTVEYLRDGTKPADYYLNPETSKMAQDIFDNKELRMLFDTARDAQPEDLKTVHDMLLALKRKELHYDDWLSSKTY